MRVTVIVGTQWGDEGKGGLCDYLAESADLVVRYQGGNNAGHTVVVGDQQFKFHLVPSGILHPGKTCIMSDGTLIDPFVLAGEIDDLKSRGVDMAGLKISGAAHVILPYHILLDRLEEERRGSARIGTTHRGIGPAYADKAKRCGIRVFDLLNEARFRGLVAHNLAEKNALLVHLYGAEPLQADRLCDEVMAVVPRLKPYVADTRQILLEGAGRLVWAIFEGAQATFLDIDYGTYPNVTSSHPVAAGACLGTGIGPSAVHDIIGVAKAYTTRVGSGPFPTELDGQLGDYLRETGAEYGTTTGRPRRCGWLDAVMLRTAARINSLSGLAITKLDVLDKVDPVRICTGYRVNGDALTTVPSDQAVYEACEPVYEDVPGWMAETSRARRPQDLPRGARAFLDRVAALVGVPVQFVSLGPERRQIVEFLP